MNYFKSTCGVNMMDGESNKIVYGYFMPVKIKKWIVGWWKVGKHENLKWFGYSEKMGRNERTENI